MTEPLRDGARKVQGNPGPGHHQRAARSGEIPGHPLDLDAGEIASRGQIVEVGVGDELAQTIYARREFGAACRCSRPSPRITLTMASNSAQSCPGRTAR